MAVTRKSKKRPKRSPPAESEAETVGLADRLKEVLERPGVARIATIALRAGLVAAVVLTTWGSLVIRDSVLEQERLQLDRWTLDFGEFPEWVTDDIRGEIEALRDSTLFGLAPEIEKGPVYRGGLLAHLRDELQRNPWVESVHDIGLLFPGIEDGVETSGQIWAEIQLRRPTALVAYDRRFYLTDAEARRLGRGYESAFFEGLAIPTIFDASPPGDPLPESGAIWGSRKVRDGVAVAAALSDAGLLASIQEIDVTNVGGFRRFEPEIVLRAPGFPPLAWGRSPISRGARLATVEVKIANLRKVLESKSADFGRAVLIRLYTSPLTLETAGGTMREPVVRQ